MIKKCWNNGYCNYKTDSCYCYYNGDCALMTNITNYAPYIKEETEMPYAIERNNMGVPTQDETAKTLLDKTNSILIETLTELKAIDRVLFGERPDVKEPPVSSHSEECLLTTLREQNRLSAEILEVARHIKGGLW